MELTGSFLTLPGRRLWVEQAGVGPAVAFVHAGVADRRMWDGQVAAQTDRYRLIRYDQPGYGASDPAIEPYSQTGELAAVLDHVGAHQAVLVGCSMGGRAVIDYALAHPDRVAALVPVAAIVSGQQMSVTGWRELAATIKAGDTDRIVETVLRIWAPLRTDPEVDARIRQLVVDNVAGIAGMGTMWRDKAAAYGRLHHIDSPTLVVVGDRDQQDHLDTARLLAREIPGARLEVLPNVDHNVPVRAGRAFTAVLSGFLESLDIRRT
jgi:pimeloyl-ACP methyl ester carboxylesterase